MRHWIAAILLPLLLAACGAAEPHWAPDEQVERVAYRHPGPPTLTLITMISNESNAGGHTGLMVNGSQRVLFDPAGSFKSAMIPERNDVLYGINPRVLDFYIDYHARPEWHVVLQEIEVSPAVAERALALVQGYGAVPKAQCAKSTSEILRQLPGFESIKNSWYPRRVMADFAQLPGVKTRRVFDPEEGA